MYLLRTRCVARDHLTGDKHLAKLNVTVYIYAVCVDEQI